MRTRLEAAYEQLCDYAAWGGQFSESGCSDADQTLSAYTLAGRITTLQQLIDGAPMRELISIALDKVEEMTGVPVPEEQE